MTGGRRRRRRRKRRGGEGSLVNVEQQETVFLSPIIVNRRQGELTLVVRNVLTFVVSILSLGFE